MIEIGPITQILNLGLGVVFYATILIFIIFTLSVMYHWFSYGIHKTHIITMLTLYLVISAVLLLMMSLTYNTL